MLWLSNFLHVQADEDQYQGASSSQQRGPESQPSPKRPRVLFSSFFQFILIFFSPRVVPNFSSTVLEGIQGENVKPNFTSILRIHSLCKSDFPFK